LSYPAGIRAIVVRRIIDLRLKFFFFYFYFLKTTRQIRARFSGGEKSSGGLLEVVL